MTDLRLGDCLDVLPSIPAASVDLVLADLPYGTTACKWDVIIPFGPLWTQYRRLLKPRGAIVLMAGQPFTSLLIASNLEWFKYAMVWEKTRPGNIFNAKNAPLRTHEDITVFSNGTTANRSPRRMTYNPQGVTPGGRPANNPVRLSSHTAPRPSHKSVHLTHGTNYPKSVLRFPNPNRKSLHPTQKPVPLMEYLVLTYSDEGGVVLDNVMGSGSTGVAAVRLDRPFIGIERDPGYFATAERRIAAAGAATPLFAEPA